MTDLLTHPRLTARQSEAARRMIAAPAGGWVATSILTGTLLGVPCEGVALQIESPKLRVWGVVMPDGAFIQPRPGRKTIDARDVAFKL